MEGWNRHIVYVALLALVAAPMLSDNPAPAHASAMEATPPAAYTPPFPLVYPIDAPRQFADTFGAPRSGGERLHQGVDLFAAKMTPVLATAAGQISAVDWSPSAGFYIDITHDGGWRSRYLHLNNDTPGTDDGLGFGIAGVGIRMGVPCQCPKGLLDLLLGRVARHPQNAVVILHAPRLSSSPSPTSSTIRMVRR